MHASVGGNEDVRRLDVTVNDQVRVRVTDRDEYLKKQFETRANVEAQAVTVFGDRWAFHVFQCEIRTSFRRDTRVIQACDVRVFEARENVSFPGHALGKCAYPADVRALQRNRAFHEAIGALRQPHAAHAALADGTNEAIGTHLQTVVLWFDRVGSVGPELRCRIERTRAHIVRLQQ